MSVELIKYAMQLKLVQTASKSRVSTPPPFFVILEVKKKIEPHYFVVVRPNQNRQKKSDLVFKSYRSQFGDVSHPTIIPNPCCFGPSS